MTNVASVGGASTGRSAVGEPFSVGRALSRTFSVFSHGFIQFIVLTATAYVPLLILQVVLIGNPRAAIERPILAIFVPMIVVFIVGRISTATCLFGAYQIMRGRAFTIGASLMVALRRFWAILATSILGGLFAGFGLMLLVVPGFIVICAIYVALPACVIERLGPVASLKRSRALTKGNRWQIFGLYLVLAVLEWLLSFGFAFVAKTIAGPVVGVYAQLAGQILVGAFASVLYAVVYHDLRVDKEGFDIEELASVFD
jgi:hypothetical protein